MGRDTIVCRQVRSEIESMRHDRCTEDTDRLVLELDISMREGGD